MGRPRPQWEEAEGSPLRTCTKGEITFCIFTVIVKKFFRNIISYRLGLKNYDYCTRKYLNKIRPSLHKVDDKNRNTFSNLQFLNNYFYFYILLSVHLINFYPTFSDFIYN
jgi:hypothetical protein